MDNVRASTGGRFAPGSRAWKVWNGGAAAALCTITVLHYATHGDLGNLDSHTLFRRLYYLPIVMLAVTHGMRGGGLAAVVVVAVYSPHAFLAASTNILGIHLHGDPAPTLEKASEIVLYLSLGLAVGWAVDRAKSTQEDLDRARAELHRAARLSALGELVAGVAHEVRNPLASLLGTAEIFLDDYPPGHERRRMAELNLEEVKRLAGIVDRFLAFGKPPKPQCAAADANLLMERLSSLAEGTARKKGVRLVFERPARPNILVDADQILQMLLNLVLNAIEASPKGAEVIVGAMCSHHGCEWTIDDAGPGVPEVDRERIFDPFFTSRPEGSGLGLSITTRIVEAHAGTIHYSQSPAGGARFVVRLPPNVSSLVAQDGPQQWDKA